MCASRADDNQGSRNHAGKDAAQSADEIRQQMEQLRTKLKDDVQEVVEQTKKLTDWRYLVRTQPWVFFGAAAALGYLLVPRRLNIMSPDVKTLAKLAKQNRLLVTPEAEVSRPTGVVGPVVSLLAGVLMRNAATIAGHKLGELFSGAVAGGQKEPLPREDVMYSHSAKPR